MRPETEPEVQKLVSFLLTHRLFSQFTANYQRPETKEDKFHLNNASRGTVKMVEIPDTLLNVNSRKLMFREAKFAGETIAGTWDKRRVESSL